MRYAEVFVCDKCGWKVPASNQHIDTECWSCLDGVQRYSTVTIAELNQEAMLTSRNMIKVSLSTRGL